MPVICITFTLTIANIVKDDFEKIYALVGGNSLLFETSDVLGTWTYRTMKAGFRNYGYVTCVTFMQSVLALILMMGANWFVKKTDNPSLW
jgi:putative aldouronate transport system permease protein